MAIPPIVAPIDVGNQAQLNAAILEVDAAPEGAYTIAFTQNISDTSLYSIILPATDDVSLTIDGQGFALNGNGTGDGLAVLHGKVTIQSLTVEDTVAQGYNGQGSGGGGAGLGGGLFVGDGATVTVNNVVFAKDAAKAGNGGGGSYGGPGGDSSLVFDRAPNAATQGDDGEAGEDAPLTASPAQDGGPGGTGDNGASGGILQAGGGGGEGGPGGGGTTLVLPPFSLGGIGGPGGDGGDGGAGGLGGTGGNGGFGGRGGGSGPSYHVTGGVNYFGQTNGVPGADGGNGGNGGDGGVGAGGGAGGQGGKGSNGGVTLDTGTGLGGTGGAGGNGGNGADGGLGGGGGGGGLGGDGGTGGYTSGPGGAGGNGGNGGDGGFGGGGGGGGLGGNGGDYGATENGAPDPIGDQGADGGGGNGGDGGFGAGAGGSGAAGGGGGGGLGAGGDIFVQQGGSLIVDGGLLSGGTASGGSASNGGNGGGKAGQGIFIQGDQSITLAAESGQTLTIADQISDQTGSGGTGIQAGAGTLVIAGTGVVELATSNDYTGGTVLQSGTLLLDDPDASGSGPISFAGTAELEMNFEAEAVPTTEIDNFSAGDTIALVGFHETSDSISGDELLLSGTAGTGGTGGTGGDGNGQQVSAQVDILDVANKMLSIRDAVQNNKLLTLIIGISQTKYEWVGGTNDFSAKAAWTPAGPPGAGDIADFMNAGTVNGNGTAAIISIETAVTVNGTLTAVSGQSGVRINGGNVTVATTGDIVAGELSTTNSTLTVNGSLDAGVTETGMSGVSTGLFLDGTVTANHANITASTISVGNNLSSGNVVFSNGSTATASAAVIVGSQGQTGVLTLSSVAPDGITKLSSNGGTIGLGTGSNGSVSVDGTWNVAGTLDVGDGGSGTLTLQQDLSTLPQINADALVIGDTGSGTLTTGGGTLLFVNSASAQVIVGNSGTGLLSIGPVIYYGTGSNAYLNNVTIGASSGGHGTLQVLGTLQNTGGFTVGGAGIGTLDVVNGAALDTSQAVIGATGGGTATVEGQWNVGTSQASAGLFVGQQGNAQLTVSAGGSVTVTGSLLVGDGLGNGGQASIDVTGGQLSVVGNGAATINAGTVTVENGGTLSASVLGLAQGSTLIVKTGGVVKSGNVNVPAGTTVKMVNGTIITDPITITAGGNLSGSGVVTGAYTNDGTLAASGGTLDITGDLTGTGLLTFAPGGELVLEGTVASTESLVFNASSETLLFGVTADMLASISGFAAGDTIGIEGQQVLSANYDPNDDMLTVSGTGGAGYTLDLTGTYQADEFVVADGDVDVTCFLAGTRIAAEHGEVCVEALTAGDLVMTRFSGLMPVKWVGYRRVDCSRHPGPRKVWPVRVRAGAFGKGQPCRDLWLSPDHAVFVDDVLIPAKYLINGTTIEQVPRDQVTYFHIELDHHDLLLAEGLPVESYLDVGDRSNFANGGRTMRLVADFSTPPANLAAVWDTKGCAQLVIHGRELEAARRWVNARGGSHPAFSSSVQQAM